MKPINEIDTWTLGDCLKWLRHYGMENIDVVALAAHRIRQITSWIPVEDALPEDEGVVRVYTGLFDTYGESYGRWCEDANRWFVDGTNCGGDVTHWKYLDKPEGV